MELGNQMASHWEAHYRERLVSPEEAVAHVRSGDFVEFAYGREPVALGLALAARAADLGDLTIHAPTPGRDFGWYEQGASNFVQVRWCMPMPINMAMIHDRLADGMHGSLLATRDRPEDLPVSDALLVEISTPDANGFCSLGASVWDKRRRIAEAKLVLAEVNAKLVRTYGENYVHVSEIDYFVEHQSTGRAPATVDIMGREPAGFKHYARAIAEHAGSLIRDGDTLQIGIGTASEPVAFLAGLDQRNDLGWHSEATPRGILRLVMQGVITGERKTVNTGVAVATAIGGGTNEEMAFVHLNPKFALYSNEYTNDPRVIAAHDNMVAINNALAIDLSGQIAAETLGTRVVSMAGGQTTFAIGAMLSRGGRNVSVLPSVATDGRSRIVPTFDPGTAVTVPRSLTDHVVTEFGVARLRGRTYRQRAEALIEIAHPDHQAALRAAARQQWWPD